MLPAAEDAEDILARQVPAPQEAPPPFSMADADRLSMASDANRLEKLVLHLAKGDTLASLLAGLELERREVSRALSALRPHLEIRRLQVGQPVHITLENATADRRASCMISRSGPRPGARSRSSGTMTAPIASGKRCSRS